jgi:hypothetical protein
LRHIIVTYIPSGEFRWVELFARETDLKNKKTSWVCLEESQKSKLSMRSFLTILAYWFVLVCFVTGAPRIEVSKEIFCLNIEKTETKGKLNFIRKDLKTVSENWENLMCFEKRRVLNSEKSDSSMKSGRSIDFNSNVKISITILALIGAHLWTLKELKFWSCQISYFDF